MPKKELHNYSFKLDIQQNMTGQMHNALHKNNWAHTDNDRHKAHYTMCNIIKQASLSVPILVKLQKAVHAGIIQINCPTIEICFLFGDLSQNVNFTVYCENSMWNSKVYALSDIWT